MCPISTVAQLQRLSAARTAFALIHIAQIGVPVHLKVHSHVESGEVVIEFVGSAHQVFSPTQCFVHDHHEVSGLAHVGGLALVLHHANLLEPDRAKVSGRRAEVLHDLFLHHGTEFASANGRGELGFVHLVIAAHQHQQRAVDCISRRNSTVGHHIGQRLHVVVHRSLEERGDLIDGLRSRCVNFFTSSASVGCAALPRLPTSRLLFPDWPRSRTCRKMPPGPRRPRCRP